MKSATQPALSGFTLPRFLQQLFLGSLLCLVMPSVNAAEMLYMEFWERDNHYYLRSASTIKAPPELIFRTLLDYQNFYRLSGGIKETRYLEPDTDGTPIAFTLIESCVLFFCRQVKKTERVLVKSDSIIELEADPTRSDFKHLHGRWSITKKNNQTILSYEMDMVPDFWIPPLIGRWALKHKLYRSAMSMAHRLEQLSASGAPLSEFRIE